MSSAQTGAGSGPADTEKFVAVTAGFSIDLPRRFQQSTFGGTVEGESTWKAFYTWQLPEGDYRAGFTDRIIKPGESDKVLTKAADRFITINKEKNGASLVSRSEFKLDGIPGIEVQMKNGDSNNRIRWILVKERLYEIAAIWTKPKDGNKQQKVLESFRLIDVPAVIAQKVSDATPAPLPQTPPPDWRGSDARDMFFKGKVKSVRFASEDMDTPGSDGGVKPYREEFFDAAGNLTRRVKYDSMGNPAYVTVLGFIDGKRVSQDGPTIPYEYNADTCCEDEPEPPKSGRADPRYRLSYLLKYDDQGRLIGGVTSNNRGETTGRSVYTYEDNRRIETVSDENDQLVDRILYVFDNRLEIVATTYFSTETDYPDVVLEYKYAEFDGAGNWTKREVRGKRPKSGGGTEPIHAIEYRTITYH